MPRLILESNIHNGNPKQRNKVLDFNDEAFFTIAKGNSFNLSTKSKAKAVFSLLSGKDGLYLIKDNVHSCDKEVIVNGSPVQILKHLPGDKTSWITVYQRGKLLYELRLEFEEYTRRKASSKACTLCWRTFKENEIIIASEGEFHEKCFQARQAIQNRIAKSRRQR